MSCETPADRYPALAPLFAHLDALHDRLIATARAVQTVDGGGLYEIDLFYLGVMKRSVDLVDAIAVLTRQWNATAALALVRLHLDTLLRLAYVAEAPNGIEVGTAVLRGAFFRDLKDPSGKRLVDRTLVDRLAGRLPWLPTVYDRTSGFVHFSARHIFQAVSPGEGRTIHTLIGRGSLMWSEDDLAELLECTIEVAEHQLDFLDAWGRWKKTQDSPAPPPEGGVGT